MERAQERDACIIGAARTRTSGFLDVFFFFFKAVFFLPIAYPPFWRVLKRIFSRDNQVDVAVKALNALLEALYIILLALFHDLQIVTSDVSGCRWRRCLELKHWWWVRLPFLLIGCTLWLFNIAMENHHFY